MRQGAELFAEMRQLFYEQQNKVEQAPAQECPVRTVPDTGQRPDDEEIATPAQLRDAIAAQRNVDVVAELRAKRDMPASPEFRRTARDIRIVEVLCKSEAKHPPQANGHIAVPREIKVNLQGVSQHPEPGRRRRERHTRIKDIIRHLCDVIRDQDLLPRP